MPKLVPAIALVAGLSSLPALAREPGGFDGKWSVELVTESGVCKARYTYALAVQDGQIRPVTPSSGATISGRVGADGRLGLSVTTSAASGSASGRLQAQSGSGTWMAASLCSGRWTARRSGMRTVQAD